MAGVPLMTRTRTRSRFWSVPSALLLAATMSPLGLVACTGRSHEAVRIAQTESIELGSPEARGAWPYWPTSIRILPLTKVARTTDAAAGVPIEVRVEALDDAGVSTRAVGTFVVTVAVADAEPRSQRWKFDCTTAAAHGARYDPVTDTYRFIVTPAWTTPPALGATIELTVVLYGADGAMPSASATLRW